MRIRREVIPCIALGWCVGAALYGVSASTHASTIPGWVALLTLLATASLLWFFRDPDRTPPTDTDLIVSAADGTVHTVTRLPAEEFQPLCTQFGLTAAQTAQMDRLNSGDVTRISVYLSLLNVHVNRAPITGRYRFWGYAPGRRRIARSGRASTDNQRNMIYARGEHTECLLFQIVGPVVRRVVYWRPADTELTCGDRIGMMKFGSRFDIYLPSADVTIRCRVGDRVRAGETPLASVTRPQPETPSCS